MSDLRSTTKPRRADRVAWNRAKMHARIDAAVQGMVSDDFYGSLPIVLEFRAGLCELVRVTGAEQTFRVA